MKRDPNRDPALLKAIDAVGSISKLAEICGISAAAVSQWVVVPPIRVGAVSKASGVPPHELRPDVFEPPEGVA